MVLLALLACSPVDSSGLPALPAPIVPSTAPATLTPAQLAEAERVTRARLPPGFTLVVEHPFLVVGDEHPAVVTERAAVTVRRAVRGLRAGPFDRDPDRVYTIWLLRDATSFATHAWTLFGDSVEFRAGYTSVEDAAIVANVETGGGTVVHEIVHAYLFSELPNAAPWFQEGFASLYERPAYDGDRLSGLPNWRLRRLHTAIPKRWLRPFPELMALDTAGFYDGDDGTHYAQARFLCLWLQDHGLLDRYHQSLRKSSDPTGVTTLREVLGTDDLAAFQREWEVWVMGLEEAG